jgi:hypothetical protein
VAEGVEWFIYNRTPAYDDIIKQMAPGLDDMSSFPPMQNNGSASAGAHDRKDDSPSPSVPPRMTLHIFI